MGVNNTLKYEEGFSADKYDDIIMKFNDYCIPQRNVICNLYSLALKNRAKSCYIANWTKTLSSTSEFSEDEEWTKTLSSTYEFSEEVFFTGTSGNVCLRTEDL